MMKIEKIRHWCPEAERGLSQTFGYDRAGLIEGVNAGTLECYRLWDGQAYLVTRTERGIVTVCCYQGARARDMMRWLRARCAHLGIKSIVFYTRHRGLARLLNEFCPAQEETVYRIAV
ncbi:MAG: hypothetical protein ACRD1F_01755 [Terriglobales bacterium]